MTVLKAKETGATYRVVTARRDRPCEDTYATYPHLCAGWVSAGEQYVRAVMFPNHDIYSYVEADGRPSKRPMVRVLCFGCASGYHLTSLLVIDAQRAQRQAS